MNRLKNQTCYLAGAIDRVDDFGIGWRDEITPFLLKKEIIVFDPLKKTSGIGEEGKKIHQIKKEYKENEKYDEISKLMKEIRCVDLRLIDKSDFLIVNLDLDVHPCGSYEEIFTANRAKKPILICIKQGKKHIPDWLFGTIPHQMFFCNWNDLKNYLNHIDCDEFIESHKRWQFIN